MAKAAQGVKVNPPKKLDARELHERNKKELKQLEEEVNSLEQRLEYIRPMVYALREAVNVYENTPKGLHAEVPIR